MTITDTIAINTIDILADQIEILEATAEAMMDAIAIARMALETSPNR